MLVYSDGFCAAVRFGSTSTDMSTVWLVPYRKEMIGFIL